jgi:hypothetical protein
MMRCGADGPAECLHDHIRPHLREPRRVSPVSYKALAPCHDDTEPSLSVSVIDDRRISWNCFACAAVLGREKAQNLTRNMLIRDGVPMRCLPQTAPDASDQLEEIRSIIFGGGPRTSGWLRIAALLDGYDRLPRGDELEALAGSCGVSMREAYRARSSTPDNEYLR